MLHQHSNFRRFWLQFREVINEIAAEFKNYLEFKVRAYKAVD
jgi:hypothetical protein